MKKSISFTLTLLMLLSLCACSTGNQNVSSSTESNPTSAVPSSPEVSSSTPSPQGSARQMLAVEPSGIAVDHNCGRSDGLTCLDCGKLLEFGGLTDFGSNRLLGSVVPDGPDYRLIEVFDSQTVTRPNKDKFIIETAGESREYNFYYLCSDYYRGFGHAHVYQLSKNAIVIEDEWIEDNESKYILNYCYHPISTVEIWERTGSLRRIGLSTEEFPEAKITGDITVEAVLNKAEEVVRMYDKDFSLAEIMTTPTEIQTILSNHRNYEDGIVEPGEGETLDGYRINCYYGDREVYECSYFTVEYNAASGWIAVYVNKDIATSGINAYALGDFGACISAKEELSKVHDLLTEEVVAESVNAFLNQHLTDPAYAECWSRPQLLTLAHQEECTIIELLVHYHDPEDELCPGKQLVLTYEIPDGTALLKDVS